ncbi:MAG: hypothetical protein SFY56_03035 [Bacteroidota bacterium]|nr:hypothetical protein [Bacteroidota bacterium]
MLATIDLKINTAQNEFKHLKKVQLTYEDKINKLLDKMNELSGMLSKLHEIILVLTFDLERDMLSFKKSETAHLNIKLLSKEISKLLITVRKSDLYPGVKTIYGLIKTENNYLKELVQDKLMGIELDNDTEMQNIIFKTVGKNN